MCVHLWGSGGSYRYMDVYTEHRDRHTDTDTDPKHRHTQTQTQTDKSSSLKVNLESTSPPLESPSPMYNINEMVHCVT